MELAIFLGSFAVLFLLGMPIAASMISSTLLYCVLEGVPFMFLGTKLFTSLNNFALIAIPLFILTAEVMNRTSVSDRIFKFCNSLVGYIPGGMGHVNIATSIIFAGMSGSAVADVGGIGHLSYRAMVDKGFDKEFSASVTIASSTVGPIIPPSIPAVVYAMVANVSVGRLLIAGLIPGILMGLVMMVFCTVISIRRHYPKNARLPFKLMIRDILFGFIHSILPMLTPVILLLGIYLGVVTTTEASAVAVLYALFLGVIMYRTMNLKAFFESVTSVFKTCGSVLLVIPAATIFSFVMTKENLQNKLYALITSIAGDSSVIIIACIMLIFMVLGCLSDPNVNIMMFVPMVMPLILKAGLDPIHAGVIIIINAMIGNITPPVGVVLMTVCSVEKLSFEKVVRELWPWIVLLFAFLIVIIAFPQLTLFLPNIIMGR